MEFFMSLEVKMTKDRFKPTIYYADNAPLREIK